MLDTILLVGSALVSMLGLTTALNATMLRPHLVGLFVPHLRHSSYSEVSDWLELRSPTWGGMLNCGYCLSGYLSLIFLSLYHWVPVLQGPLTVFLASPLLWHFVKRTSPPESSPLDLETVESAPTPQQPHTPWRLTMTDSVRERVERRREDPAAHRKLLQNNADIISILNNPGRCETERCREIVAAYQRETAEMRAEHERNPETCPECMRGDLINKYFFMLGDEVGFRSTEEGATKQPFKPGLISDGS